MKTFYPIQRPILGVVFCLFIFSCSEEKKTAHRDVFTKTITLNINPNDTAKYSAKHIVDSLEFIPLETKPECFLGKIDKMLITEKYFAVLDKTSNGIYFFFKNGKFSHKITGSKPNMKAGGQLKIWDFDIDGDKVYISDLMETKNGLLVYNIKGQFLSFLPQKQEFLFFKIIGDNKYFFQAFLNNNERENFSLVTYRDNQLKSFFPYNPEAISTGDMFDANEAFFQSAENIFFAMAGKNAFYKLNTNQTSEEYKIALPEAFRLPDFFLEKSRHYGKDFLVKYNRDIIWNVTAIYKIDDRILSINLQSMNKLYYNVFFDLKSKKTFNARNLLYGESTYWLPIFEQQMIGSDGYFFYSQLSSKFLFKIYLQFPEKEKINRLHVLKKYFATNDIHSNPVITKFKIHNLN